MKFRDLFELKKKEVLPDAERIRKKVLNRRLKLRRSIIAASSAGAAAVVAIVAVVWYFAGQGAPVEVAKTTGTVNIIETVLPTEKSEAGMKVDSSILITTTEDVSTDEMAARLSVQPEAEYKVQKKDSCQYELVFSDDLQENTLYNLEAVYNGTVVYRWAFQTETVFCVTGSTPNNESSVSLDSAIEVTFSHSDVTGFEEAFEIVPALEGTFEHYGRTWAFVPSEPMDPRTLYTVTVRKEVSGPDEMNLEEDYTFSFTTYAKGAYAYLIYQDEAADTFLADETPVAAICYDQVDVSSAQVRVYRLADSAAYIDAYKNYVRNGEVSPEITALAGEAYQQFDVTPALTTDYNNIYRKAAFVVYPEPLPLGYYFTEIQIGGRKLYQLLQSTTLSVYTITTNGDYTVWVNDTQTGAPVSGAALTLDGFKEQKTGKIGTATFSGAAEETEVRFLTVENGDYPYVAALNGTACDESVILQNDYYTYLSTNSRLYKATDTVEIFGMILPRRDGAKIPDEVTLSFDFTDEVIPVEVESSGYFSASISLKGGAFQYGYITLEAEGVALSGAGFEVADYELPDYQITVYTDQVAYFEGETVYATAQVTYMDGTPAPNLSIQADGTEISGYTDENGCFTAAFPAAWDGGDYHYDGSYPDIQWLSFSIDTGTDLYYSSTATYMVFDGAYFLKADYTDGRISIWANEVDKSRIVADSDGLYYTAYEEDHYKGAAASVTLTGELHAVTYEKSPSGTTYDAINKKVVYSWQYEKQDTLVRTFEVAVDDGLGAVDIAETPDENTNYYVLFRLGGDEGGIPLYVYLSDYDYESSSRQTYNMTADKDTASIGEEIQLLVRSGSDNEAINSGSVLYTAVCGEIIEIFHSSSSRYTLKFKETFAPDVLIYGAYFDGKHVYSLGSEYLQYDSQDAALTIEMEKDQENYQPGDQVNLSFHVTDASGKPVKAMLNLSVMDQALYLAGAEPYDPLYSLYFTRCFSTEVYTTCSHRDFSLPDLGEGGGGGDMPDTRVDFEDTPYFETVWTDKNGDASVSFTLPDTITEWKVIARAITQDVKAGNETFSLRSSQAFFAQVTMAESVKSTDDLTIAVKGDGAGVAAGSTCSIKVGLTDQDGNEIGIQNASAVKSQYAYLNFGKLNPGIYSVYIQVENGTLQDSVIQSVTIEEAQASAWIHHQQEVGDGFSAELDPQGGNVVLTIADQERSFYLNAMARLRNNSGQRVDQVLGKYLADQFYSTGIWMDDESLDYSILESYVSYDGVKLTPDSEEGDLKIAAKMAAAAPEFCNREMLLTAFEWHLNNRYAARVDVIASYFGLAALGEPVLTDLQTLYSSTSDLTEEEAAYLALAFAYGGDYDTARYLFESRLEPLLVRENGTAYAALNGAVDEDLTGCCAMLCNRLSLDYSEELISYIIQNDTQYTLLNLELITYLNNHIQEMSGENTVVVSTGDGHSESYTYQRMEVLTLNLSAEQASSLRITNGAGASAVSYAYYGRVEELFALGGGSEPAGLEIPTLVSLGGTAQITLLVDIPEDYELPSLELTLPAGLRFLSGTVAVGDAEYEVSSRYESRSITAPLDSGENTITLTVRGALPGSYVLEPIVITNSADHRFIATDSARITVSQSATQE